LTASLDDFLALPYHGAHWTAGHIYHLVNLLSPCIVNIKTYRTQDP
jgi:hypothetical protein